VLTLIALVVSAITALLLALLKPEVLQAIVYAFIVWGAGFLFRVIFHSTGQQLMARIIRVATWFVIIQLLISPLFGIYDVMLDNTNMINDEINNTDLNEKSVPEVPIEMLPSHGVPADLSRVRPSH